MNKNKMQKKKLESILEANSISLRKFLINYGGAYNNIIINEKINHNSVKYLFPHLKRIGFDTLLDNISDLYNGKIIAVKDSYGHVLPYIKPELVEIEFMDDTILENVSKEEKQIEDIMINENLSNYELSVLCKKFKELNRMREYNVAYRILNKRKNYKIKKYKKEKIEMMMEERDYGEY